MANKEKITLLSKHQMQVLYYKCKEGATHAEIADLLDKDVNTVQYHMTNIYTDLEIKQPGKSKEEMESELKNEICPIIREMFDTFDKVKIWAPIIKDSLPEEKENPGNDMDEPVSEEPEPPYIPPPSVEKILNDPENQPIHPEIIAPPPPPRGRINWWLIIGLTVLGFLVAIFLKIYPSISASITEPTETPDQPTPASTEPTPNQIEVPTNLSAFPTSTTFATQEINDPTDGMVLIPIPAGEFQMGNTDKESPQHTVYLDAYWIDKTEVSNAQYVMCVAEGGCAKPANNYSATRSSYYDDSEYADYPVIFVSWSQAVAYCAWAGRRLPTEAEWEKAARGPEGFVYPWGNTFDGARANYCDVNCQRDWKDNSFDDGYFDTSPVGTYPNGVSLYGVLDMAGNVHEWVADWFAPYSQNNQINPTGPDFGQDRIMRGGSWGDDPDHIRSSIRSPIKADNWLDFIGFRCAVDPLADQ